MTIIDVPSIKSKYIRWVTATIAVLLIIIPVVVIALLLPIFKEIGRAYRNFGAARLIRDNLGFIIKETVKLYSGNKGNK